MRIDAGWGEPPQIHDAAYLNTSRVIDLLNCQQLTYNRHVAKREPDRPTTQALQIGTIWHSALEAIAQGTPLGNVVSDAVGRCKLASREASQDGCANIAKDLIKFATFCEHALPLYVQRYGINHPTGRTLATEQAFWLSIARPNDPIPSVVMRGRIDKIGYVEGKGIVNGEVKTVGKDTDPDAWLSFRRGHIQDRLYHLALVHAPIPEEWGIADRTPVYGTVYDLTFKHDYPQKAVNGVSVEQRREEWTRKLFHTQAVPRNTPDAWGALEEIMLANVDWLHLTEGHKPQRNRMSCMQFGRRACPYFSSCWEGVPLTSSQFRDRNPDYVDEGDPNA